MRVKHFQAAFIKVRFGVLAVLLDDPSFTAVAADLEGAQSELGRVVLEALKQGYPLEPSDCPRFELLTIPVEVRPEIKVGGQLLPQEQSWEFRFPVAVGKAEAAMRLCVVPHLELQFFYEEERSIRELVGHYVQATLKGLSPAQLLRQLPGEPIEIRKLRVKTPVFRETRGPNRWPELEAVAELAHLSGNKGFGRESALQQLVRDLQGGQSVALVGPASVGKTTLIREASRRTKNIWLTSAARLVAGMTYLGMWEKRCEAVIAELVQASGVLAVESVAELIRQGGRDPGASIAAFMTPYVMDGRLQLVVEASAAEWQACRRLLPGFADLFRVVPLEPMSDSETAQVLAWVREGLRVPVDLDDTMIGLFRRFSPYEALPGAAVRFLRQLGRRHKGQELTRDRVFAAFSERSSIPEEFLLDEFGIEAEEIQEQLARRVIGQPEAQAAALRIITSFKAGLNDPQRPLGVLLLCGPTGVGKTELAKTLAEMLFSDEKRLIRLDMSEYAGAGAAERLLGSLYDRTPSAWLRELRLRPFSVVLFDEVEKAHPEVFDVLMRAFDEGQLTDPWGRLTSLRCSVLLMTSNLGAEQQNSLGLRQMEGGGYSQAVRRFFRPELINRLDAVVPFHALTPEVIRAVARREIALLERRPGLQRRGVRLLPSERCLDALGRLGYDQRLGARPLQRLIERRLVPEITRLLSESSTLREIAIDSDGDQFWLSG